MIAPSPKITIVSVVYNIVLAKRESFLRQNIESVHEQTYKNIEHIIVDGGSKDGTMEIVKEYADKGYVKYISEPDSGIYDAMNKGVGLATGEYIAFLNSDDFYQGASGVEDTVKALLESGADFAYSDVKVYDENSNFLRMGKCNLDYFFARIPVCHQTLFVKTKLFYEYGMFDLTFSLVGDFDFIYRLFLGKRKGIKINEPFVAFRVGGLSTTREAKVFEEIVLSIYKNLNKYAVLSMTDCQKIFNNRILPYKLWLKIGLGSQIDTTIKYIFRCFSIFRHWLVDVKTGKGKRLCLLGCNIIGTVKKRL